MSDLTRLLSGLLLLCLMQLASATPQSMEVTGTASDPDSGKLLYREYHTISPTLHTVRYVDAAEKLFASKEISYQKGYSTPEYKLIDRRFHRTTGSKWQDNHFVVYRLGKNSTPDEKIITPARNLVIDAGFDYFIRSNWDQLVAGKVLTFSFAVADPLTTLDMKIEEVSSKVTAINQPSSQFRYFRASSNNSLISWAIPEIHLAYDHHTHLLQIYHGPSNITDTADKKQTVSIKYQYERPMNWKNGDKSP